VLQVVCSLNDHPKLFREMETFLGKKRAASQTEPHIQVTVIFIPLELNLRVRKKSAAQKQKCLIWNLGKGT